MPRSSPFVRYGLAVVLTLAALLLHLWLPPAFFSVPFFVFVFAIAGATALGGRGPGILALIGCAIAGNVLLLEPVGGLRVHISSVLWTVGLALVGVVVMEMVERYGNLVAALRRDRDHRTVLVEASASLERSLDFDTMLTTVARIVVPRVADWCSVDLLRDGKFEQLAIAHQDPAKIEDLRAMMQRYPPDQRVGVGCVLATKQQWSMLRISDADLVEGAVDSEHLAALRRFGFRSAICTPILYGDQLIGVLCAAMAESRREYTDEDRDLLTELANRAALAIERAELFSEAKRQRERAEQASRTKDQFLAILGHELRNPLAPITIALELMAERDPEVFQKERSVIDRQVRALTRLVDDLLDISRIVRGRIELRNETLELADVVTRAIETTEPLINERRHVLRVDVPAGMRVLGDDARLVQVVANLLTNASKYTDPGGRIEIEARRSDGKIWLRVRDSGIGIAPEMLPRVFDMFVQEPQSLDRGRGGLGLGLAIVRNIVQMHGGTVDVHSEGLGKGSEFIVELPAIAAASEDAEIERVPRASAVARNDRPVLVVDDNRDVLDLLADGLERRGFATVRATDARSALALAADIHPTVALLDLGLPVIDGFELGRRLHELDASMHLIAVTGYGQPADVERAKAAGFEAHLVKPVSLEQVQSMLSRIVTAAPAAG